MATYSEGEGENGDGSRVPDYASPIRVKPIGLYERRVRTWYVDVHRCAKVQGSAIRKKPFDAGNTFVGWVKGR